MKTRIDVLDHGYVELLNISGPTRRAERRFDADDIDPANAARGSFDQRDSGRDRCDDLRLNRYLIRNGHNTPLEMVECWFEMKLPIFVARQFVRHRTATINEMSARYVELPEEYYVPDVVGGRPINAKQGQSDGLDAFVGEAFKISLREVSSTAFDDYRRSLSDGVAPEHARMLLPVNTYTKWLWKQDLYNLSGFLRQRCDSHAQLEAQKYANAIRDLVCEALPDLGPQLTQSTA